MNASSRFVDTLAVQYRGGNGHAQGGYREKHVSKRKQRNRDLEIVFDADSHKDYVTGFRKRKQQRRKEAIKSLEKLQRESRLEERAERREARKEQYNLGDDKNNSEEEEEEGRKEVTRVFEGKDMTSTVRVTAIETEDDVDERALVAQRVLEKKKKKEAEEVEENGHVYKKGHHKLSKKALSVLTNTKMKLQGKKKFAGTSKQVKGGKKNSAGKDAHRRGKR